MFLRHADKRNLTGLLWKLWNGRSITTISKGSLHRVKSCGADRLQKTIIPEIWLTTDATCKRLKRYKGGIELIANNPTYEPLEFSNEEILEKPVRIIGKVVELRRKF